MGSTKTWSLLLLQFALFSAGKAECQVPELEGNVVLSTTSILKNSFPDNTEAYLECGNGYKRESGSVTIICTDGRWSTVELICKKIDCGVPEPSPHMYYEIKGGTLFSAAIRPKCERGYYLEGSSYRHCLVNGWSGKSSCEVVTCEKPLEIIHGMIVTTLDKEKPEFKDVIEYSCNAGYKLIGNKSITCSEDGEYNSDPPTCQVSNTETITITTSSLTTIFPALNVTTSSITKIFTSLPGRSDEDQEPSSPSNIWIAIGIGTGIVIVIGILAFLCVYLIFFKRKGSYNTGEGLRTKQELLQNQSL